MHWALFARVTGHLHVFDLLHDLIQIVACRILQRWEVDIGFKLPQPQRLANGQQVPVVLVSCGRCRDRSTNTHERLYLLADRNLERIAFDVDDLVQWYGTTPVTKPAGESDTIAKYIFQFL